VRQKIVCPACGHKFIDNTEKHKSRPKYCPNCRYPYRTPSLLPTGILQFKKLREALQRLFVFFPVHKKKQVYYECPRCHYQAYSEDDIDVQRIPDKIKYDDYGNEEVLSWRYIPVCPRCGTGLIRRSRDIHERD